MALGEKQRELSALLIDRLADEGETRPVIGEVFLAIELLKAQISRLAANIDAAQVGAENVTFRSVRNNAITLEILMARLGLIDGVSESGLIASLGTICAGNRQRLFARRNGPRVLAVLGDELCERHIVQDCCDGVAHVRHRNPDLTGLGIVTVVAGFKCGAAGTANGASGPSSVRMTWPIMISDGIFESE